MRVAAFVRYAGADGLGHAGWAFDLGGGLTDCGRVLKSAARSARKPEPETEHDETSAME